MKQHLSYLIICWHVLMSAQLNAHGFDHYTLVRQSDGWCTIEQVCQSRLDENQQILSYDLNANQYVQQQVKSAGESETTCYIKLGFDELNNDDIVCTPTQEFYVPATDQWVPAYTLKVGDALLSECNTHKSITHIEFVKKPLTVYSIEVERTHTFFVSRHSILTHNIFLPALSVGLSIPFGTGAGSIAGSIFGPVTLIGGAVIGSILGVVVKALSDAKVPRYQLVFDGNEIEQHFINKADNKSEDAQAPGKPTENDGYKPPKKWDGKKVRNPNGAGYGWPDKESNVWIPSGPKGHGGVHWDVEDPDGSYENIVPGGRIRGKK